MYSRDLGFVVSKILDLDPHQFNHFIRYLHLYFYLMVIYVVVIVVVVVGIGACLSITTVVAA